VGVLTIAVPSLPNCMLLICYGLWM